MPLGVIYFLGVHFAVPFLLDAGKGNAASEFLERRSLDPMRRRLPTIDGDSLATNMRTRAKV